MTTAPTTPTPDCLRIDGALVLDPGAGEVASERSVAVIDGRFASLAALDAAIRAGARPRVMDGRGRLLMPGLVNAHTHSPLNVLKGTGDALSHPAFMWLNQADTARRTPDEIRLSVLLGAIEHLSSGTTAVIDHFPEQGFAAEDVAAVVDGYETAGLRALVALRIFDEPYADIYPAEGLPEAVARENPLAPPPLAESLALVEDACRRHHRTRSPLIEVCPGPSNPMRCSDDLLAAVRDMAERYDTRIHTHLLETEVQTVIAQSRFGTTMVRHLDRIGVLGPRLSCAHTIWIDDDDIALMAAREAIVVHNPESNLKLGAGIAPIARMLAAGVTVALGTDGASTNDNLDMHEAMRIAVMLQRPFLSDRRQWPSARDGVAMATSAGGVAMGLAGLGSLAPGAPADFVLHDLNAPSWVPLNDPVNQLVFTAGGSTVRTVVVAGRVVVEDGQILTFDAAAILAEARGIVTSLRGRNGALHDLATRVAGAV